MRKRVQCYYLTFPTKMDADTAEKAKARRAQALLYLMMAAFTLSPLVIYFIAR